MKSKSVVDLAPNSKTANNSEVQTNCVLVDRAKQMGGALSFIHVKRNSFDATGDPAQSMVGKVAGGITMKVDCKSIVRTFLCTGLLLGVGVLAHAQEPNTQSPPAADNTKTNERDRNANEPTADQQKENRSDRDITQQIRQSIMKDKSLSTYAHNVKIITKNGQVTLKGPVQSEDEKRAIEGKATEVAGENKVASELNVRSQH